MINKLRNALKILRPIIPELNIPNISSEFTYANLENVRNLATYSAELDLSDINDSINIIESLINNENLEKIRVEREITERIDGLTDLDIKNEA
ncbi:hypothetical protein BpHYR1_024479 [Brachionus plicatilis]|uniref:Uncharacterized protein n=1 Tax=Brachionus plicatilis TaxID=10195 RepID=A0A3M7SED7_BRAPC|nr:hypothetical protein BpHYR1_024479 [Brachionus plicatilis]